MTWPLAPAVKEASGSVSSGHGGPTSDGCDCHPSTCDVTQKDRETPQPFRQILLVGIASQATPALTWGMRRYRVLTHLGVPSGGSKCNPKQVTYPPRSLA